MNEKKEHDQKETWNIQVWVRNASGSFLIVRCESGKDTAYWTPVCAPAVDGEDATITAARAVREITGLRLTLSMGGLVCIADGKDYGYDHPIETFLFDYQNEELDIFTFGRPEIHTALWISPGQIRELVRCGLWVQAYPICSQSVMIGPFIPFEALSRDDMLKAIDSAQSLTAMMLNCEMASDAEMLSNEALSEITLWAGPWHPAGTDQAARRWIYSFHQAGQAAFLLKKYEKAEDSWRKELCILSEQNWKTRNSALLKRIAGARSQLELVCNEMGKTNAAKREKKARYDILKESERLMREERAQWKPGHPSWPTSDDDTIFFSRYYIYESDDQDSITLRHYHPDNDQAETLTIADRLEDQSVSRLTGLLYSNMENLEAVTIEGTSLKDMAGNPFGGCRKLRRLSISPENHSFRMVGNCLLTGDGRRLILHLPAAPDTVCEVPEGTIVIGRDAFNGCTNLARIVLPSSVRIIEDSAFYHCDGLEEINLPDSLAEINSWTFANCSALKQIQLPSSLRRIWEFAFTESGLEKIELPRELDLLDGYAFSYCEHLAEVSLPVLIREAGEGVFEGCPVNRQFKQFEDVGVGN